MGRKLLVDLIAVAADIDDFEHGLCARYRDLVADARRGRRCFLRRLGHRSASVADRTHPASKCRRESIETTFERGLEYVGRSCSGASLNWQQWQEKR